MTPALTARGGTGTPAAVSRPAGVRALGLPLREGYGLAAALIALALLPWYPLPKHYMETLTASPHLVTGGGAQTLVLTLIIAMVALLRFEGNADEPLSLVIRTGTAVTRAGLLVLAVNFTWFATAAGELPALPAFFKGLLLVWGIGLLVCGRTAGGAVEEGSDRPEKNLRPVLGLALLAVAQVAMGLSCHYQIEPSGWRGAGLADVCGLLALLWLWREIADIAVAGEAAVCRTPELPRPDRPDSGSSQYHHG